MGKNKKDKKSKRKRSQHTDGEPTPPEETKKLRNDETEQEAAPKETKEENPIPNEDPSPEELPKSNAKPNFFSESTFDALNLSESTSTALRDTLKLDQMTHIQAQAIPPALAGKDVVACAETGSGKTLAFLIPCLELLRKTKFTPKQGTGVMVLSPTRELAMQIYGVLQELSSSSSQQHTYGLIMGGANRRTEAEKLGRGVNTIVCTPGRLLDHLQNTKPFKVSNLLAFVMDEADRILEQGFEEDLRSILKLLPKERQTLLFSATQTKRVQDLIRLSVDPGKAVTVEVERLTATASNIEQGYVNVPSAVRFRLLFTFLKKNLKKKLMVFFSSCNSVKFHAELLNYIDIPVTCIHGRQKQVQRTTAFFDFCQKKDSGILLCTDVAARGLDIPAVDWILQYDPPDDPVEYIHRVGRTARGATGKGRALLFLTPHETAFLSYLRKTGVQLQEFEFAAHKIANIQPQLERVIESNYYLNRAARDAFRSYLLAYASHGNRTIFDVHALDLQGVGTAFGFRNPPRVDIGALGQGKRKRKPSQQKSFSAKSGHAFSAENPYGKRDASDTRQFTH